MLQLKEEIKLRVKEDQELQLKIAKAFLKKNIVTVQRWIKSNSQMLALPITLDIIRKHLGLNRDVELVEPIAAESIRA